MKRLEKILLLTLIIVTISGCGKIKNVNNNQNYKNKSNNVSNKTAETTDKNSDANSSNNNSNQEIIIKYNGTESLQNFYKVVQKEKNNYHDYKLTLYNKNKEVIKDIKYDRYPYVNIVDNNILGVMVSFGSPDNVTFYYNTETGDISQGYENVKLAEEGKVIYMVKDKLIISDIFDKNKYYKEIVRNFSPAAASCYVLKEAKFVKTNMLFITYFVGENYDERSETIDLGN